MHALRNDMILSATHTTTDRAFARSSGALTGRAQWTGRARVSSETNTVFAHITTSGLHRTRVSALRNSRCDAAWRTMPERIASQRTYTMQAGLELLLR